MRRAVLAALVLLPVVALALYPPTGFDETLYHLPMVRAIAAGGVRFYDDLRFPVFPMLAELLAVPLYLVGGDVATHFIPLLAMLLTAALLIAWARLRNVQPRWLPAAAFLGMPVVVHLATSLYVDLVLTLFVTAGFYCLERARVDDPRRWLILSGLAFGAACDTKYLGLYFAGVAALTLLRSKRIVPFALAFLAAALPMYAWLVAQTGNPVFPFFGNNPWALPFPPLMPLSERIVRLLRIPYDVVFARDRIGMQPPFTPLFGLALIATIALRRTRWMFLVYLIIFTFLPLDARYLMPLMPLVLVEAATLLPPLPRWLAATACVLALLPGPAYAIYRIVKQGAPTHDYLIRRVPEYRALQRAGAGRVYSCGGEELKAYARGTFLGDHAGPYSFDRVLNDDAARLHANLAALRIDALLIVRRSCRPLPLPARGFTLLYEDEAAQLWRVGR